MSKDKAMIQIIKLKQRDRLGNELFVGDDIKIFSRKYKDKFVVRKIVQQGLAVGIISAQGEFRSMYYFPSRIIEKVVSK